MSQIGTSLSLQDLVTGPARNIVGAMNHVIDCFETLNDVSGASVDISALQDARAELAQLDATINSVEDSLGDAGDQQNRLNNNIQAGVGAAESFGSKIKGIAAAIGGAAVVRFSFGFVTESLDLADTQRNAENQLKLVLANMGVQDVEVPVTTNTGAATEALDAYSAQLDSVDAKTAETTVRAETQDALRTLNKFERAVNPLNGAVMSERMNMTVGMDTKAAMDAVSLLTNLTDDLDGTTVHTSVVVDAPEALSPPLVNAPDMPGIQTPATDDVALGLSMNTAGAVAAYTDFVDNVDGKTVTVALTTTTDTTQTMSAFDAITAKAADIQSKGIYGDEAMIAGAAEFATYFSDGDAILSMMDTLADYAMGMSGGGEIDSKAMVDYATGLGKIMSGSYEAMTKKGFEFTDAQKAIIEGTATQAQIVETLGAEYLDASADMQAAAAINSVIAEAWDGLYESMSNTPEGKIIQFNNKMGDLRESIGNQLYPYVLRLFETFEKHFPQIQSLATGFASGLGVIITILSTMIDVVAALVDNWGWLGPIVLGVAGAYMVLHGAILAYNAVQAISNGMEAVSIASKALKNGATLAEAAATTTATGAQVGLNAALFACPITWIVLLVIALIAAFYAAVGAINKFAGTSLSATGLIAGAFTTLGAHVINQFVVPTWNMFAAIANFFGNVFNDPVAAVKVLFYDMALTVIGYIKNMAQGIEDLLNKIPGVTVDITSGLDSFYKGLEEAQQKVKDESGWVEYVKKMDFIDYSDAAQAGYEFGQGIEDSVAGAFDFGKTQDGLDEFMNQFNMDTSGIAGNTADIAESVGGMSDSLECSEEDLKYLRDIAEQEAINRFTTAEIVIEQHNENHIASDMDVDGIMDKWTEQFTERLDISEEGVHE